MKTNSLPAKIWRPIRNHRWLLFLLVAALVTFIVYGCWRVLNSPAKGEIKLPPASNSARQILPEYVNLDTDYFVLSYSDRFIAVPTETTPGDELDYSYAAKTNDPSVKPTEFLEITTRSAQPGGITLDKDYKKYFGDSKNYKFTNKYYQGEAIDFAMKQTGGTDQVGLWLHGNQILVVHIKKDRNLSTLDSELKDIMTSVQWKQN